MPAHDWTRLTDGDFHDFHQCWIVEIRNALNGGLLPPEYMAMTDQVTGRPIPDVVTLRTSKRPSSEGGVAIADAPPSAQVIARFERNIYAKRADRVVIRHGRGEVIAIIEIVSPGDKSSNHSLRTFVQKATDILSQGIHLLIVDLFPPTARDPKGIQKAICEDIEDLAYEFPPGKPLTVGSYLAGDRPAAYLESLGVGDQLPSLPIFLSDTRYIPAPLESSYQEAWKHYPAFLKQIIEKPQGA